MAAAVAAPAAPASLAAQQAPAPAGAIAGPLVRLSTPTIVERPRLVGTLIDVGTDALTVRTGAGETVVVPRPLVRRYEVSRGRMPRGPSVRRAALVGLALGAVVGAVFTPDHAEGESSRVMPYTLTGAAVGAAAGGVFGSVDRPERWERTDPPAPR